MPASPSRPPATLSLIVYHAKNSGVDPEWLAGLPVNPIALFDFEPSESDPFWPQLFKVLRPVLAGVDVKDLVIIQADQTLPEFWLSRLAHAAKKMPRLGALSPISRAVFKSGSVSLSHQELDALIFQQSERLIYPVKDLNPGCCWLSQSLVQSLKGAHTQATFWMMDHLVLGDSVIEAHELNWSLLLERVQACEKTGQDVRPLWVALDGKPVLLHVTHSWGGGTAQWIQDYTQHADSAHHLILKSEGDWQTKTYGQKLVLQLGWDGPVLLERQLDQPIHAVASENIEIAELLQAVIDKFAISQILVSSLIGHSLDVFRTGLKTTWLHHDYFPICPALNAFFSETCRSCQTKRLSKCLRENPLNQLMAERDASFWLVLRKQLLSDLRQYDIHRMAPDESVALELGRLDKSLSAKDVQVLAHGLPDFLIKSEKLAVPSDFDQTEKLRLVVIGEISEQKGLKNLEKALDELMPLATVYLVGCGKAGKALWGRQGVHIIHRYQREALEENLKTIQPHLALFLSQVPETFGLALEEVMQLGVVPVATRLGAFASRIQSGKNGFLISADAQSLVACIQNVYQNRELIKQLSQTLASFQAQSMTDMVRAYQKHLRLRKKVPQARYNVSFFSGDVWRNYRLAVYHGLEKSERLNAQSDLLKIQDEELNNRAQWARNLEAQLTEKQTWLTDLETALQQTQSDYQAMESNYMEQRQLTEQHMKALQDELEIKNHALADKEADLVQKEAVIASKNHQLQAKDHQLQDQGQYIQDQGLQLQRLHAEKETLLTDLAVLQADKQALLSSTSWRITAPMRGIKLGAKRVGIKFLFLFRKIGSLLKGLVRNLRTRGLFGTFKRINEKYFTRSTPASAPLDLPESPPEQAHIDLKNLPRFTSAETVTVSIIIPVYNQLHYTLACLNSLQLTTEDQQIEVIVVDDCSSDETATVLPQIEGLIYHRNPENLGFVGSCNAGAGLAKGEFVFFLNNDTTLQENWLTPLLKHFKDFPLTGLVGSKLVYPDGRLQESGGIVFSDASGWNAGRFEQADNPGWDYARQVDYCSGAAILLPRALFEELGRFDQVYAPAYYEDTDLAFKIREKGLQVWVQPKSVVVHHEGVSCGTDTSSGMKRHQVINQKTFMNRWAKALAQQPSAGTAIELAKEHRVKGRVLIVDACTPTPDQDSGSVRMQYLLKLFIELGYKVSFLADNRAVHEPYTSRLQAMGVEMLFAPWVSSVPDWFEAQGKNLDLIILSRHYVAVNYLDVIEQYASQAKVWFDTVDLHYLREQRMAEVEKSDAIAKQSETTKKQELRVARASELTLVVSGIEKQALAQTAPDIRVESISNIHEVHGCSKGFDERSDLMFIGGYQHTPNIDAAIWFVNEIFPLVREQLPDIKFHLIGSKATAAVKALGEEPGVIFHGFVEDIEPFLHDVRIAVAPLRYGAGVKGKVNMSMSYGQPVVGTAIAFEGMFTTHEVDAMEAETAQAYAEAIVKLYQDECLWQKLSEHSLQNVQKYFSYDAAKAQLAELLKDL